MSRYDMDVRLARLGRKQVDVISELRNRGFRVTPAEFSFFKNGRVTTPKSETVLKAADEIVSQWEAERDIKR